MKSFIRALGREAESRATALATNRGGETATLYFGGGTPSMLSDTHLGRLMETLDRLVPVDKLDEFSFEANPATFTEKKVRFWRSLGIHASPWVCNPWIPASCICWGANIPRPRLCTPWKC